MFSVKGDTVLDPFLGTGTTTLAAIASCRNSIGKEIDPEFSPIIRETLLSHSNLEMVNNSIRRRIKNHLDFINQRLQDKGPESIKHYNESFDFPVMTRQEKDLIIQFVKSVYPVDEHNFNAIYVQKAILDYQGAYSLFSNV